jgi:hypothetical protein
MYLSSGFQSQETEVTAGVKVQDEVCGTYFQQGGAKKERNEHQN